MIEKRFWRCNVCNDVHYGARPPEVCPTCRAANAYVEISVRESADILELELPNVKDGRSDEGDGGDMKTGRNMGKEEVIEAWRAFTEKNDFRLNPEEWHVSMVADGVLANERKTGLKLCPCRLSDGSRKGTLGLICPCNFKSQQSWKEKDMCWCGLFLKR